MLILVGTFLLSNAKQIKFSDFRHDENINWEDQCTRHRVLSN